MKKIAPILLGVGIFIFSAVGCHVEENVVAGSGESANIASEMMQTSEPVSEIGIVGDSHSEAASAIEDEPPDNDWQLDAPENHGIDGTLLDELHDVVEKTEIYAVVIVKEGYIVDEYYKDGYDEHSVFRLNSCTKSFTGALIGIAIDKGLIGGVNVRLSEFFPQLATSGDTDKQEITIEDLLTHTSGLNWPEWGSGPMFRNLSKSENWVDFVLAQPMAAKPGSTFNYSTGGSHLLSAVIQEATGETAHDFAVEHLFGPLGMDSVRWSADPQGITDGGNGISMSARDAAKFGQLYLDHGRWKERQVVPETWVEESITYQSAGSYGTGEYGYQWWIKSFGKNGAYSGYYAMGYAGQYIFVVPELELVTVITGRSDTYAPQSYFNDYIIAACAR